ncbi:hypothetical protein GCM10007907_04560 [Chitinimonas prasina]|uniref:DUF4303 domain-containing protein n=1 Tax=Chitinimonas prasina TaxID=1434937 RepID=A0ABQ5YAT6_9NEIS|nr:DUF4303 domain-containing protein [Chitinimonas prasina]GLR11666.1 hypothetical protein GCM10007907_04560 [Chitinimonas prasina]
MFAALKSALHSATTQHYRLLRKTYSAEELYGYSLYTDDSLCSIGPVANTSSQIAAAATDPMYNYYRYGPHEWSLWADHGLFDEANDILKAIHADQSLDFDSKRDGMLKAAFVALTEAEAEGLFGPRTPTRFLALWLSDSADPIMVEAAKALNSHDVFSAFCSEYANKN